MLTETLNVRVNKSLIRRIKKTAHSSKMSAGELTRLILKNELDSYTKFLVGKKNVANKTHKQPRGQVS